jgi:hypothetical protein
MKLFPRFNQPTLRPVLHRLSRCEKRQVQWSLWACLICFSITLGSVSPAFARAPQRKPKVVKPAVTDIQVRKRIPSTATAKNTTPVSVEISGKGFGKTLTPASVKVVLTNIDSGEPSAASVTFASDTKIFARAELPTGEEASIRSSVGLDINGQAVNTTDFVYEIPIEKPVQPKPRSVEVDIREINNPQNPTLHSVLITPKDDSDTFATDPTDPKAMKVQILPPGATNVTIDPVSTPERTLINFAAADGFKVQDVLVTIFDSRTRERSEASVKRAAIKQAGKSVKITKVDVVSLQRRDGFGRLKIEGEGFGDNLVRPTQNGDVELLCDRANRSSHVDEREDTNRRPDTESAIPDTSTLCPKPFVSLNRDWRWQIERSLKVILVPRNSDLRVERTLIMYADDKLIDVYFEFSHWPDYSEPFRLESVSVSVTQEQPASAPPVSATANGVAATPTPRFTTYLASFPIGPPKDTNLEYRYTVLDQGDASELFGSGVGDNFYVLQLSVINNGDKKLVVPLSSIQAEIEWSYKEVEGVSFDEGPPTLSPLKLSAITSYFDTFQKTKGRKARIFNILDGVGTLAASLVPVFGKGLERGNSILSGGLIPGLRQAWGDLSSQQLQNLTSMSWDSVEEIPAGGAKEKFIYIQRSDQSFSNKTDKSLKINKSIKSIQGLEVSGFVVNDSQPASAVRQQ